MMFNPFLHLAEQTFWQRHRKLRLLRPSLIRLLSTQPLRTSQNSQTPGPLECAGCFWSRNSLVPRQEFSARALQEWPGPWFVGISEGDPMIVTTWPRHYQMLSRHFQWFSTTMTPMMMLCPDLNLAMFGSRGLVEWYGKAAFLAG